MMKTVVTIGADGNARLNGNPIFLIGARHIPDAGSPALLAEAGFNAWRWLPFGVEHDDGKRIEPPPADEGIYFWTYIYDRAVFARASRYRAQLEEVVSAVKAHPRMLCYENYNEVAMKWKDVERKAAPGELEEGTRALRKLDPDHPIWLAHDCGRTVETLREYNGCMDILGCNPYPVQPQGMKRHYGIRTDGRFHDCPDQSVHAVGRFTEKMIEVGGGRKPVWMLIQAMANEHWFDPIRSEAKAIDESKILYPTYEQIRFMAYDAIISGATGLAFSMFRTSVNSQAWRDVTRVVAELRRLHDMLCALRVKDRARISYTDLGYTIWDGVGTLARQRGKRLCLFAANRAFDPAEVSIRVPLPKRGAIALVTGENREVPIERGFLRDSFSPFGVHVYEYEAG